MVAYRMLDDPTNELDKYVMFMDDTYVYLVNSSINNFEKFRTKQDRIYTADIVILLSDKRVVKSRHF